MNRCNSRQLIKLVRKNAQNCAVCDFSGGVGVSGGIRALSKRRISQHGFRNRGVLTGGRLDYWLSSLVKISLDGLPSS